MTESDIVSDLSTIYGFFFVLVSVLLASLPDIEPYLGQVERYLSYGLLWFLGMCFLLIGLQVKELLKAKAKDHPNNDWKTITRSLWFLAIGVSLAFVYVTGEILLHEHTIFLDYSLADAGATLFLVVFIILELKKSMDKDRK